MTKSKSYRKSSTTDTPTEIVLLNPEQIAARRIPLEDAEIAFSKPGNWHCHYCNRKFIQEGAFMKHFCEPKRRAQELSSPIGQAAFGYYREWMRMKKYSQPGAAAFMESKFYRSFINFAQMVIDANISRPDKYMELMVVGEVMPLLWCRDTAYAIYLEWTDKLADPMEQVGESINYLMDVSERENVELKDVFAHLGIQQVLSLVRQRRLTPWLLFCSSSFKAHILSKLDASQVSAFGSVINAGYWTKKFETESGTLAKVKAIVAEFGL